MAMHACYFTETLHRICVNMTLGWCAGGQLLQREECRHLPLCTGVCQGVPNRVWHLFRLRVLWEWEGKLHKGLVLIPLVMPAVHAHVFRQPDVLPCTRSAAHQPGLHRTHQVNENYGLTAVQDTTDGWHILKPKE